MYASRGIGRHTHGDRRFSDRGDSVSDQYGSASPDASSQMANRDTDKKPRLYDDRRDYKDSPTYDNSYNSSSRDGFTPPGPSPSPQINDRLLEKPSYVPNTSAVKPMQPICSPNDTPNQNSPHISTPTQNFDSIRAPPKVSSYPPTASFASHSGRAPPAPSANPFSSRYGPDPFAPSGERSQKEIEEEEWGKKCAQLFKGVNSIEEFIDLKESYANKAQSLNEILQRSNIREGEILRNRKRDRSGFKDPMMLELKKMQNDMKNKLEEVNKFRVEIDKRIRAYNKLLRENQKDEMEDMVMVSDKPSNYEAQLLQNSMISSTGDNDEDDEEDEYEYENSTKEYYDPGSHWCRDCDKMVSKLEEFFDHLHTKDHWKIGISDNSVKPWRKPKRQQYPNNTRPQKPKIKTAIRGVQFLIPLRGFYCPLCKDYLADNLMAEEHMKGAKHNRIYNRFVCINMDYEHKWSTDKGKALARHQNNERKRIKEEEQKELERKKKLEEQRLKEEKEAKKKRKEEEARRREKEEREREWDREEYKKKKREESNQSERFRLKEVTLNLKEEKLFSVSHSKDRDKERGREREREKHKKRTRIYSSSDSSSSPPRKKQTWFGDPYKDPKLKKRPTVKLMTLNKKVARKYHCEELIQLLEEAKKKKERGDHNKETDRDRAKTEIKCETKAEGDKQNTFAHSPIKMDIDVNQEEDNDNKDLKGVVDGILESLDDNDKDEKESREEHTNDKNAEKVSDSRDERELDRNQDIPRTESEKSSERETKSQTDFHKKTDNESDGEDKPSGERNSEMTVE